MASSSVVPGAATAAGKGAIASVGSPAGQGVAPSSHWRPQSDNVFSSGSPSSRRIIAVSFRTGRRRSIPKPAGWERARSRHIGNPSADWSGRPFRTHFRPSRRERACLRMHWNCRFDDSFYAMLQVVGLDFRLSQRQAVLRRVGGSRFTLGHDL